MVFCGLCKEAKEPRYHWMIQEIGANSRMGKFRVCDDCASELLRDMLRKVHGIRDGQELPSPISLSKTGIIEEMVLRDDNSLEITVSIDIGKARRIVERSQEEPK
ncbi:MAG: hypothetical protein JW834_00820 [Candidatus Diapherotrites archaeon]|nr:hypothetical protein [Candidatus Diapherotrites archaeon]